MPTQIRSRDCSLVIRRSRSGYRSEMLQPDDPTASPSHGDDPRSERCLAAFYLRPCRRISSFLNIFRQFSATFPTLFLHKISAKIPAKFTARFCRKSDFRILTKNLQIPIFHIGISWIPQKNSSLGSNIRGLPSPSAWLGYSS